MVDHDYNAHNNEQDKAHFNQLKPPVRETKLLKATNPSSFGPSWVERMWNDLIRKEKRVRREAEKD